MSEPVDDLITNEEEEEEEVDEEDDEIALETDALVRHFVNHLQEQEKMLKDRAKPRTRRYLNKYEKARLIGARACQLDGLAPPYVDVGDERQTLRIAIKEFEEGKLPLKVQRFLPGKDLHNPAYEICQLSDLVGGRGN